MFRAVSAFVLAALAAAPVAAADTPKQTSRYPYPAYEMQLPNQFYKDSFRLTPREYRRHRAMGFSRDEVFMIANAARETGLEMKVFADAIYRGMYARDFASEWGLSRRALARVLPEWKTQDWATAVGDSIYTADKLNIW